LALLAMASSHTVTMNANQNEIGLHVVLALSFRHCCVGWSQRAADWSVTSSGRSSVFAGYRFPREVIAVAVRWYLRYGLSYRDAEELLAERGVTVDHVTIYRWVQRFTPEFIEAAGTAGMRPETGGSPMRPT
jgi:hypothetical protein